jgi:hypothetical protein
MCQGDFQQRVQQWREQDDAAMLREARIADRLIVGLCIFAIVMVIFGWIQ